MLPSLHPVRQVTVQTGSRLHFGLIRAGKARFRFGGLGIMIESPKLSITARHSDNWIGNGALGDRAIEFAKEFCRKTSLALAQNRGIEIHVTSAPPPHSGLGSGTQLTLAAAASIYALAGTPLPSPRQLALETGRGQRSAIGCHGFYQGGLLFEGGKQEKEPLSELQCRVDFPLEWRFVLIRPKTLGGVAGLSESRYFESAPMEDEAHAQEMIRLAREVIIPAAFESRFDDFSEALFRYGWLAGEAFVFAQGDVFSHPETRERVEDLRKRGVQGVGQSSWGPTVFALVPSPEVANELVRKIADSTLYQECEIWISAARNRGAEIIASSK